MAEEMTYSEYDLEVLRNGEKEKQRQFEIEKREAENAQWAESHKHERSMERIKHVFYAVCVGMVVAGIVGFVYVIWQANAGLSAKDQRDERLQNQCIDKGGSWLALEDGSSSGKQVCLYLKEAP